MSYSVGDIGKLYQEEAFDISHLAFMLKAAENDASCILQARRWGASRGKPAAAERSLCAAHLLTGGWLHGRRS